MKKRVIAVIIILAVVATTYVFRGRIFPAEETGPNGVLKLYGTVEMRDASLTFKEQERLAEVLVEEGDSVKKGQIIAHQETNRLEASIAETSARLEAQRQQVLLLRAGNRRQQIDQAKAEVEATKAQVANSRKLVNRYEKTPGTTAISQQDLDDARSQLAINLATLKAKEEALSLLIEGARSEDITAAEMELEALQASLSLLNIRRDDMTLRAPSDGIIESRILEPGEMAGPQQPVLLLALTRPKWVRVSVSEPDLGSIRSGMEARITSDSFPDNQLPGTIGFISPSAEFTPRTVQTEELRTRLVYQARVVVPDPDDLLRLGMPVTVMVETKKSTNQPEP